MFGNFFGMFRKRRRVDAVGTEAAAADGQSNSTNNNNYHHNHNSSSSSLQENTFWDTLFNSGRGSSGNANSANAMSIINSTLNSTSVSTSTNVQNSTNQQLDRPFNLNERFVTVLDQLDARVEKFRKDALGLQEKRDFLLMSVDLIKSHDLLQNMGDSDRDEIICYIHRVNSRLSTVELNVRTVRDSSQEDSLSQINELIDLMITLGDPVMSRQRCQQYLNSCASGIHMAHSHEPSSSGMSEVDGGPVDKHFENALLGCTLDDQKNIKRRLQALMNYLNKQTVRHQPF